MKIKLMIISLIAVFGLQGMDSQLAKNNELQLSKALNHCITLNEQSSVKIPLVVALEGISNQNASERIQNLMIKVINDKYKNVGINFFESANASAVYSRSNAEQKTICNVCKIIGGQLPQEFVDIEKFIKEKEGIHLFITINKNDTKLICNALKKDVKLFSHDFEEFKIEEILKAAEDEVAQFYGRQLGSFITFKNFLTNHRWVIAGGASLAAFLAYYYKFAR